MIRKLVAVSVLFLAGCVGSEPHPSALVPLAHGDFDHNTLALTWQPGFCSAGGGCTSDQPRQSLVGLHGLWASEPHSLEAQNVPVERWWREGCGLFVPDAPPPVLDNAMLQTLGEIMPHTNPSLLTHEWVKHGACFGYDPGVFFAKASALQSRFSRSPMMAFLAARAGTVVGHDEVLAFFRTATGATQPRALQLRCETDQAKRVVLTQLWFTLDPKRMGQFPSAGSYLDSPQMQDNCPASFWLKNW
ncbi:ribonuclease T2 family protein [Asaia siamensis]|uniref:Ribonuclease I n=1 Tax=Asaia siamensis TaxID=110479 RepID=A0ABQ1LH08_9PROT|nr:ribonuclease I [Asaia siamensis]GBR07880.1 ribonuclease I [Asaia siamensis NRIC 0323]GGC24229.1 ribonuclease I [Asaia siamensis]